MLDDIEAAADQRMRIENIVQPFRKLVGRYVPERHDLATDSFPDEQ